MKALVIFLGLATLAWPVLGQQPVALDSAVAAPPVTLATQVRSTLPASVIVLPATTPLPPEDVDPPRVGYVLPTPPDLLKTATWQALPDGGYVLRAELVSAGASGLRVQFPADFGSAGMELRVFDPAGAAAFGPYTHPQVSGDGTWWTPSIFGEAIGLEFYAPDAHAAPARVPPVLAIAYRFEAAEVMRADCLEDVSCYPAWASDARAVGRMEWIVWPYVYYCTGAMLNRTGSDFAPMFMTARHCISQQTDAASLEVVWFYQTDVCDGNEPDINTLPRNNGSLLLKTHADSEWTLLGLWDPAQADVYLGWDSGYWANQSAGVGIHHPFATPDPKFKRITEFTKTDDSDCLGATQEWYCETSLGAARPGSSGSPAFDSAHRVRGTLSCAGPDKYTSCPPDEWLTYGAYDAAFPIVRWYLYDMASPAYVDGGVAGDPGNSGDSERGTAANPFNTVYEGTFCVPSGGEVYISPGSYNEQFHVWRPMTLRRSGTSGVVTIGQ